MVRTTASNFLHFMGHAFTVISYLRRWPFALALVCVLHLAACSIPLPTLRYRLTMIVDTPEGRRSGSSVVEIRSYRSMGVPIPQASGVRSHVRGEATPVALPNGNHVFAVLKWDDPSEQFITMLVASFSEQLPPWPPAKTKAESTRRWTEQIRGLANVRGVRPVKPKFYPVVAYFEDPSNPNTIRTAPLGNIEAVVPGVRLVGMTVEITDAKPTSQLTAILPWIAESKSGYYDPQVRTSFSEKIPEYKMLSRDEFIREPRK